VELQHAPENIRRLRGDVIELNALGLDRPVAQGQRAVVRAARKCQTQLAHRFIPRTKSPELPETEIIASGERGVLPPPLAGEGWGRRPPPPGGGGGGGGGCPERPYHVAPPPCPSPASGGGDDVAPPVRTLYSRNLLRFAQALDQRGAQQKSARELGIFRGPAQLLVIPLAHRGVLFRQQPLVADCLRLRVLERDVAALAL